MRKKARLLPALAFAMALVPVAEVAAIGVITRHEVAVFSVPDHQHGSAAAIAVVQDPFFASNQTAYAGSELIMVDSTPVWVRIH
jgi:hypothetical protein